ncbi:hypothetical protein ACU686_40125 [Yinghuangia aomiensis]
MACGATTPIPARASDVPSILYSYSFAQNGRWSRSFPRQGEILDYLHACAARFDLSRNLRFRTEVTAARYDAGGLAHFLGRRHGGIRAVPGHRCRPAQPPALPGRAGPPPVPRHVVPLGGVAPRPRSDRSAGGGDRHRPERRAVRPGRWPSRRGGCTCSSARQTG